MSSIRIDQLRSRSAPIEMTEEQFRSLGYELIDRVASFLASIREREEDKKKMVNKTKSRKIKELKKQKTRRK